MKKDVLIRLKMGLFLLGVLAVLRNMNLCCFFFCVTFNSVFILSSQSSQMRSSLIAEFSLREDHDANFNMQILSAHFGVPLSTVFNKKKKAI